LDSCTNIPRERHYTRIYETNNLPETESDYYKTVALNGTSVAVLELSWGAVAFPVFRVTPPVLARKN